MIPEVIGRLGEVTLEELEILPHHGPAGINRLGVDGMFDCESLLPASPGPATLGFMPLVQLPRVA
jgi:hypothetical protein